MTGSIQYQRDQPGRAALTTQRCQPRLRTYAVHCAWFLASCLLWQSAHSASKPFTVADSIAMTRLVGPSPYYTYNTSPPIFHFSPGGKKFAIITRKGNLGTGFNEYSLVLFDAAEVLAFINSQGQRARPQCDVIATFEIGSDNDGIEEVKWLSGEELTFIGRGRDQIGQVYEFDLKNRKLSTLTDHPNDIAAYDISLEGQRLVYSAYTAPEWSTTARGGHIVEPSNFLYGITEPRDLARYNLQYFLADLSRHKTIEPALDPTYGYPREISISPNAEWAVVPNSIRRYPLHWSSYDFLRNDPTRLPAEGNTSGFIQFNEAFGAPSYIWSQYQLVNLTSGDARPLLDAPTRRIPWAGGGKDRIRAQWSTDGRRVLLPPSYLPLDAQDRAELARRTNARVIAEVDVSSNRVNEVFSVDGRRTADGIPMTLTDVRWTRESAVLATFVQEGKRPTGGGAGSLGVTELYRKRGERWFRVSSSQVRHPEPWGANSPRLWLQVAQDLNTPPEIRAQDPRTGRQAIITDLNPQLRELTLGRAEIFEWQDRLGRSFSGGLVLPPNFRAGVRYPVVMQSNDFDGRLFLADSAPDGMSPHAARALANRDIVVLQMPRGFKPYGRTKYEETAESLLFLAQFEGAVDALSAKALIDPTRVGLIGFSRNGMYVHYAATFSKYTIKAATVADSICLSPRCYTMLYGRPYSTGMDTWEETQRQGQQTNRTIGAGLWGEDGVRLWLERSDLFHLDQIRTAIRYEAYGPLLPGHWENFAILKRYERPVEMLRIPQAQHVLKAPLHIYASKEGNVDWFAFWLRGWEDPDPKKAEQYERWRRLRNQYDRLVEQPRPDRVMSRQTLLDSAQ